MYVGTYVGMYACMYVRTYRGKDMIILMITGCLDPLGT